jgi:hypothetical protein
MSSVPLSMDEIRFRMGGATVYEISRLAAFLHAEAVIIYNFIARRRSKSHHNPQKEEVYK